MTVHLLYRMFKSLIQLAHLRVSTMNTVDKESKRYKTNPKSVTCVFSRNPQMDRPAFHYLRTWHHLVN